MLRFNTHYLVGTVANGGGIDGFALTQAGDEEVVGHFFGGFHCITGMHGKTLLSTARHHHCNGCSQYHFFHFLIPDNIIFPGYAGATQRNISVNYQIDMQRNVPRCAHTIKIQKGQQGFI